jgi:prevent-host-death family protein
MHIVNMHEAKTKLSSLVEEALAGEDVIIAKAGTPLVKLIPVHRDTQPRKPGRFKGMIRMAADFDQTPEEIIAAFEGNASETSTP